MSVNVYELLRVEHQKTGIYNEIVQKKKAFFLLHVGLFNATINIIQFFGKIEEKHGVKLIERTMKRFVLMQKLKAHLRL